MAERFKFRLRDLLWAVSLIGASIGLTLIGRRIANEPMSVFGALSLLFYATAFASFTTGLGCLFRAPILGLLIGFVVGFILIFALFASFLVSDFS